MNKQTVRDVKFTDQRVLVRVDFNVPLADGHVTDDTRIRAALPTLNYILEQKPKALIPLSHLGRPKGTVNLEYSLKPVASVLAGLLDKEVTFCEDCVGTEVEKCLADAADGSIFLLENTRFHEGETKNDPKLAKGFAELGDIFVNDAFGAAHRAHASNVGVAEYLPAVAGLLLEKEINYLANTIDNPERPFVAILGGAKVSDKIQVIDALLEKADYLLIGGGMANTFNKARGIEMGDSLVEADALETARDLLKKDTDKLILPVDSVIADKFDNDADFKIIQVEAGVPAGWQALDIGPDSLKKFGEILNKAKTIVWNGPMGVFEMPNFANGTFKVAEMLAERSDEGAISIIGGGDSAAAAQQSGLADRITHISTGGGASLELLEGKELPGLAVLADKE